VRHFVKGFVGSFGGLGLGSGFWLVTCGIFIATCYFPEDAREFATHNNIECLDGPALAVLLKEHDRLLPEGIITEHLKAPAPRL